MDDLDINIGSDTVKQKRFVQGVGTNEMKYPSICGGKIIREYNLWRIMLYRCSTKHKAINKAYADATCSENFKSYSYFYEWCQTQTGFFTKDENGRSWQLDKDILVQGNKLYGEDTCVFLPPSINCLLNTQKSKRGQYPVGVYWSKSESKFRAQLSVKRGKRIMLGSYNTHQEAFSIYKIAKEAHIKSLAEKYKHQLDQRVYDFLVTYTVKNEFSEV